MIWFFLNLLLLAVSLGLVFSLSFRFDSSFFSGMTNQMDSISKVIGEQVSGKSRAETDEIVKTYSDTYGAEFFIFDNQGRQLGGREITLPAAVLQEIKFPEAGRSGPENQPESKAGRPPGLPPPPPPGSRPGAGPPGGRGPLAIYVKTTEPPLYWSGARFMFYEPGNPEPVRARIIAVSDSISGNGLFFDLTPWLIIAAIIFLGSTLFWLPFVRNITKTIGQMSQATARIAGEDFNIHVDDRRTDELGRLATGINHLADRLAGFVTGQKRFLGDISHELNSPLARMQFALSLLETRLAEDDLGFLEDVREEVELMSKLVSELLTYSKAGITAPEIKLENVRLLPLVERLCARENAGTEAAQFEISVDQDLTVCAHYELLSRALGNLIGNAVRYAGPAGPIVIKAESLGGEIKIEIADEGPGVPEDSLEKLFDPFYRIESDRSRLTGGTGLGLAIVKTCIEACRGKVFVSNRQPKGLLVTIVLEMSK